MDTEIMDKVEIQEVQGESTESTRTDKVVRDSVIDEITEKIEDLKKEISFLNGLVEDVTYDSFGRVIDYYESLLRMTSGERAQSIYGLTSTYGLLLLNSTYDVAVKEIFRKRFSNSLNDRQNIQYYLGEIIDNKILNKHMTNIKHKQIKDTFSLSIDNQDSELQRSITIINDLIETRNKIAHGLETSTKGHNDLIQALKSVVYYLNWYSDELLGKFPQNE
ncbi:HEPN domain-containing protein [Bacillus sp. FSL W7-1034]|uniref:HEPN domain-containing protein n=1 Tax=Bacillus sp. FSL W7-1034 TaxID=2954564 RepID=UPI00315AD481